MNLATIMAFYAALEAIWGSKIAHDFLGLFVKNGKLTEDQVASLEANHADYQRRISDRTDA